METALVEMLGPLVGEPIAWIALAAVGALAVFVLRRRPARRSTAAPELPTPVVSEPVPAAPAVVPPAPESAPIPVPVPVRIAEPTPEPVSADEPTPPTVPALVREPESEPEPAPAPPAALPPIPPAPVSVPPVVAAPPTRLRDRLRRTSEALAGRLSSLLGGGRALDPALIDELEEVLMTADLGVATAASLLERVRREGQGMDGAGVRALLKRAIAEKLEGAEQGGDPLALAAKPHVILVLGVNGAGKTTTIGKLAAKHLAAGHSVLLGAGDTFRAAAIEQLQVWGKRVGCDVIAGEPGGDPAAVAFETVKAAVARGVDVAIVDTAGRLQTKKPLMEELGKIARVLGRDVPGAPHETLLVLDANTGQNALSQAKLFTEVAKVSALVLTKLDGTAKGGVVVGLADQFGIPVKFVGVGESVDDLRPFEASSFADALFDEGD